MRRSGLAVALVALFGCSSSPSSGTAPPQDTGAESAADTTVSEVSEAGDVRADFAIDGDAAALKACGDCVNANCGTELSACLADATCVKRVDCMQACPDTACQIKCGTTFPGKAGDDLVQCTFDKCKTECIH